MSQQTKPAMLPLTAHNAKSAALINQQNNAKTPAGVLCDRCGSEMLIHTGPSRYDTIISSGVVHLPPTPDSPTQIAKPIRVLMATKPTITPVVCPTCKTSGIKIDP